MTTADGVDLFVGVMFVLKAPGFRIEIEATSDDAVKQLAATLDQAPVQMLVAAHHVLVDALNRRGMTFVPDDEN